MLAAAGLIAVLLAVPAAFVTIKVVGAAYLIYLGVQALRTRHDRFAEEVSRAGVSAGQAFVRGLVTNLLNPKMVIFTLAFLPQFIAPERGPVLLQFAVLEVILVAFEFLVGGPVGVLAGRIDGWLRQRRRMRRGMNVAVGGISIGLGAKLVVDH